jgi:hypothetical protein
VLTNSENEKIEKFRKLLKENDAKKAFELMRKEGANYGEDFAKAHKKQPAFSNQSTAEIVSEINPPSEIILRNMNGVWIQLNKQFSESTSIEDETMSKPLTIT